MKRILLSIFCAAAMSAASAVEWTNLEPDKRLGGRIASAGYLRGKVVLLDCRDYGVKENFETIRQLQGIWRSYKTKPFIVIGGHTGQESAKRMAAIIERLGVTYPVYAGATATDLPAPKKGGVYVLDATGRCVFCGDARAAAGVVGSQVTVALSPTTARQWKALLDYEIENLPGQALLRLRELESRTAVKEELATKYPEDLARYTSAQTRLKEDAEVRRLAKLVELARLVKDRDPSSDQAKRLTRAVLEKNIEKYSSLRESANAFVAQEAKNAIADLKFAEATLDK